MDATHVHVFTSEERQCRTHACVTKTSCDSSGLWITSAKNPPSPSLPLPTYTHTSITHTDRNFPLLVCLSCMSMRNKGLCMCVLSPSSSELVERPFKSLAPMKEILNWDQSVIFVIQYSICHWRIPELVSLSVSKNIIFFPLCVYITCHIYFKMPYESDIW